MRTIVCKNRKCILKEVNHMDNSIQAGSGLGLSPVQFTYTLPLQRVKPNTGKNKRKSSTPKKQRGGKRTTRKGKKKVKKQRKTRRTQKGKGLKRKSLKGKGKRRTSKRKSKSRK